MDTEQEQPIEEDTTEFSFYDIAGQSDVSLVSSKIEEKYGFTPSDEYVEDLILFVNDMLNGPTETDAA